MKSSRKVFINLFIVIACFYFNMLSTIVSGQPDADLKELRVQGGNVQFIFNSMSKYTAGFSLSGHSVLKFRFNVSPSTGWQIKLKACSSEIINDEDNAIHIPLSSLNIVASGLTVTNDPNEHIVTASFSPSTLSETIIAEGDGGRLPTNLGTLVDIVSGELVLSYTIDPIFPSIAPNLDLPSGYYFVDLEFIIVPKP